MEQTNRCRNRKSRSQGDLSSSLSNPSTPSESSTTILASSSLEGIKKSSDFLVPILEHPEGGDSRGAPDCVNVRCKSSHASESSEFSSSMAKTSEIEDESESADSSDISLKEGMPCPKRKTKRKTQQKSHKITNKLESKPDIVDFEAEYFKEYRNSKPTCPRNNCKCQMCYVLNMSEDESEDVSSEDEGLDAFAVCWDIKPLASKRGIRISYKNALAEGIPLTPAEDFQRQEDLEHQKFLDFVIPFEKKMCEARAARTDPWIWDAIFAFCTSVFSYACNHLAKCKGCKAGFWNLLRRVYFCFGIFHHLAEQWRIFKNKHSAKVNFVNFFEDDGIKDTTDVTAKSVIIDMQSTSLRTRYF